jgi:PAS domain S-box-containing protein
MVAVDRAFRSGGAGASQAVAAADPALGAQPRDGSLAGSQGRILSRAYSMAVTASAIPLIVIIVALAVFQFTSQRDQLLDELEDDAVEHSVLLGGVVKDVRNYVLSLGTVADIRAEAEQAGAGIGQARAASGMRILLRQPEATAGPPAESALAAELAPHMRLSHRAMPYLRWSYYLSGGRDLAAVFPLFEGQRLGGALGQATAGEALDLILDQEIYDRGLPEARPSRTGYWTRPYSDPGGAGWVVAYARPVERDGQFVGVVGTALGLDFLSSFVRAFDYPAGRLWLVDREGQVLASWDGRATPDLEIAGLADMVSDIAPGADAKELLAAAGGFRRFGDAHVLTRQIASAPWRLLFVVSDDELNGVILPRFIPYGVILAGLAVTLVLAHQLRQRLIIRPALGLVEFIRSESEDRQPPKPALPRIWRPWLDAVADAFAAKRASIERIRTSEQHFRTIAEAHPVPVGIVRLDDRTILHASQTYADLFGLALQETKGQDIGRFYADPAARRRLIEAIETEGSVQGFEIQARKADGTAFPASLAARIIEFEGTPAIIAGVVDLSAQKRAEAEIARQREALRESEQRFRTIAEAHPVPVFIVRRYDWRVLYASRPLLELLQIGREQVADLISTELFPSAEERERLAEALREDRTLQDFEISVRRPDGSVFPAAVTARTITYEGEDAAVFGIVDLSEQKRVEAEMARQQAALHQSEKLNALGSLLASVAHELNNPLSVVVGYATMMRDLAPDAATKERAIRIHAAAERCARIVKTFLAMARRKPETRDPVSLDQVIEAALEIAGYGLRTTDVSVTLDFAPDLPEIAGDGDQLTLVMMNLIVNAQHALQSVPPPRRLEIRTRRESDQILIEIADNGPGIPPEIMGRIFEPFYTTKPQGIGTGIGLSVCRNVLSAHGGDITVAARPKGGTRFSVALPVPAENTLPLEPAAPTAGPVLGRILVVEDETEIADMLAEMLRRDGHDVLVAQSGREALALLELEHVDLVVTDLHMPDLGGPELHRALVEQWPELARCMMFMTGDVLAADLTGFLSRTGLPVLEKPIDPYDMRLKIRAKLAAGNGGPPAEE